MAESRQYAVYLCPCNPRGENRLLDELRDFRLQTHADPKLRCMMHWWGPPENAGTIHSSFCGFMQLSDQEASLLAEGLREGAAHAGSWCSADPLLPRLPVVKRAGAAAVCFETRGLEPLADLLAEKLPKYRPAVERRRATKGATVPSKSMSVIQGDCGDGCGPRIDDFRPLLADYPLIAEMLASTSPAAEGQEWVLQWGKLRWELQLVSTRARWDEAAGLLEAARRGPVEPWKTWEVHERVPLEDQDGWRAAALPDKLLEQQRSISTGSDSTTSSSRRASLNLPLLSEQKRASAFGVADDSRSGESPGDEDDALTATP